MEVAAPMTEESVRLLLEEAGARVRVRPGRTEHYGSPRDFSFEIKASFENKMGLHIVARQYNYRDPWKASGRVNDMVDVSLVRGAAYVCLPKGYDFFQGTDMEEGVDVEGLKAIIEAVQSLNPKVYDLQRLTGEL